MSTETGTGMQNPPASETVSQGDTLKAILWMGVALAGFSIMAMSARSLSAGLGTFEIMTYRSLVSLIIVLIAARLSGTTDQIRATDLRLHGLRNVFHFAGQNLWFFAVTLIPLAQLFALEFSYPIIVALLAPLLLGETTGPRRIVAALVGFAGILIVARPFGVGGMSPGLIAAMLCAVGFAGSTIFTKKLTRRPNGTLTVILFWMALMQLGFGVVFSLADGEFARPEAGDLIWLLVIGTAGLGAHFGLTSALKLAPASLVTPVDFLRLPLIAIIGMLLYNEPLDAMVFVGAALIFGAVYANILLEARQKRT